MSEEQKQGAASENQAREEGKDHKNEEWVLLCKVQEMKEKRRACFQLQNRTIVVFYTDKARIHAVDGRCYHAGGPLWQGDIEELGNREVVVCPWHSYRIDLQTGEGLYQDMSAKWKIKPGGQKQRTHPVKIVDDSLYIHVTSPNDGKAQRVESDHYCPKSEAEKAKMGLIPRKPAQ